MFIVLYTVSYTHLDVYKRQLKHIISATSTERRVQALEVRILKTVENKILLREHTGSKMTVEERSRRQVWKRRQKQFSACLLRGSGRKGRCDISSTPVSYTHLYKTVLI